MTRSPLHRRGTGQRGAALLVAITSIAILTAVSVDLAYNTRVSLQAAVNARDELRAYYLAKSAVSISRLVLNFQQQLDASGSAAAAAGARVQAATANLAQGQQPGVAGALQAGIAQQAAALLPGLSGLSIRLWDLVPIDSAATALFLGGGLGAGGGAPDLLRASARSAGAGAGGAAQARTSGPAAGRDGGTVPGAAADDDAAGERRAFGDIEGSFHATIQDEDRKINLRQFDGIGALPAVQTMRLAQLIKDQSYDFLFDREDANGIRVTRKDLFGAVKDWEDEDETSSTFTGDPAKPFENGYGDENQIYQRLPDRYRAKNAPFDSMDELYLVSGITDTFMAAFGDRLTVYPDVGAAINVNTDDPRQLMVNALLMSDPPGVPQPALADPAFMQKLQAALTLARPLSFMSITPQQFASVLGALGVKVQQLYLQAVNTDQRSAFGNRSSTFLIRASGTAGEVRKTIEAVVTFDRRAEALAQDTGRLLHWREE
jgi:general secretion pathway protein K